MTDVDHGHHHHPHGGTHIQTSGPFPSSPWLNPSHIALWSTPILLRRPYFPILLLILSSAFSNGGAAAAPFPSSSASSPSLFLPACFVPAAFPSRSSRCCHRDGAAVVPGVQRAYVDDKAFPGRSGGGGAADQTTPPPSSDADSSPSSTAPESASASSGNLGDIMAPEDETDDSGNAARSPTKSGLVTAAGGTLQSRFRSKIPGGLSPLERIALTANGNLQRIVSSYYDAPVQIRVESCERRRQRVGDDLDSVNGGANGRASEGEAVWDRVVHILVHNRKFCTATSVITVHSPDCVRLVESGEVGIGQLFRHLDKLPTFALLDAGRTSSTPEGERGALGGLWRTYELESDELTCHIREEFVPDAWSIVPLKLDHFDEHDNTF